VVEEFLDVFAHGGGLANRLGEEPLESHEARRRVLELQELNRLNKLQE
jgi:hypothetical protein